MKKNDKSNFDININIKAIDRLKIMLTTIEKIIWSGLESISPGISNVDLNNHKLVKLKRSEAQSLQRSLDPLLKSLDQQSQDTGESLVVNAENVLTVQEHISTLSQQLTQKTITTKEAIITVKERTGASYYNRFTPYFISSLYVYPETIVTKENEKEDSKTAPVFRSDLESAIDLREKEGFDSNTFNMPHYYIYYYPAKYSPNKAYNFKILGTISLDYMAFPEFGIGHFALHGIKVPIMNDLEFLEYYLSSIRETLGTCLIFSNKLTYLTENFSSSDNEEKFSQSLFKLTSLCFEFFEIIKWKLENYHGYCLITDTNYTLKDYITRMGMLGYFGGSQLGNQIKQEILDNDYISYSTLATDLAIYFQNKIAKRNPYLAVTQKKLASLKNPLLTQVDELETTLSRSITKVEDCKSQIKQIDQSIEEGHKNMLEKLSAKEKCEEELNKEKIKNLDLQDSLYRWSK